MLPDLPNPVNWLSAIVSVTGISLASICGLVAANWLHRWLAAVQSTAIRLRPLRPTATAAHLSLRKEMKRALVHWLFQTERPNAEHLLRLVTGALLVTVSTALYLNPPTEAAVSMVRVLHRASSYALLFSYAVTAFFAFRWRWKWHQEA